MDEKHIQAALKSGVYGTKGVSTTVSFEVYGIVHALGREHGVSAAQIIRNAVELYLTGYLLSRDKPSRPFSN